MRVRTRLRQFSIISGIALGGISTYLYQVVIARVLGPIPYGLVASILAIMGVIGTVSSGLSPIAAKASLVEGSSNKAWRFDSDPLFRSTLVASLVAATFLSTIALLSGQDLRLGTGPLILTALYIPLATVFAISVGRLQGSRRLVEMTWISSASAVMKFLTIVPISALALGATSSIALSLIVAGLTAAAGVIVTRDISPGNAVFWDKKSVATIITFAAFWALANSDLVAVKVLSTDESAGIYAASVSLGRICVLLTVIYVQYRFTRFLHTFESQGQFTLTAVLSSILPVIFLGLSFVGIFYGFGNEITKIIYGSSYASATSLMVPQAILSILISANFVLINFLVIANSRLVVPAVFVAVVSSIFGYLFSGTDSFSKFAVLLFSNFLLMASSLFLLIAHKGKLRKVH